jgi:thiopurine S-methyltransferase
MQPEFWHERWRTGQIGFHQPAVDRNLTRHWPNLRLAGGSRVLVPLCGKSLDMLWLRDQGHWVIGVELSATALEAFCMENGIPARRRVEKDFDVYEAADIELHRGDFFGLTTAMLGAVAAVYDRAALISWSPELRASYALHLAALMSPGTQMLLVTLEYREGQKSGPPFSVQGAEVRRLYSPQFTIEEIAREDVSAAETRMRSTRGITELFEVCYRAVRR